MLTDLVEMLQIGPLNLESVAGYHIPCTLVHNAVFCGALVSTG